MSPCSLAALPWMASILAPRGINAGLALNLVWLVAGMAACAVLVVLMARRLSAVGAPVWPAPAVVGLLAALLPAWRAFRSEVAPVLAEG